MNIPPASFDERLWRLGKVARLGEFDSWGFGLMTSFQRQSKWRGRQPSARQDAMIEELLPGGSAPAGTHSEPGSLIDLEDTAALRRAEKVKVPRGGAGRASCSSVRVGA
jgi:hypothetical protein